MREARNGHEVSRRRRAGASGPHCKARRLMDQAAARPQHECLWLARKPSVQKRRLSKKEGRLPWAETTGCCAKTCTLCVFLGGQLSRHGGAHDRNYGDDCDDGDDDDYDDNNHDDDSRCEDIFRR